LFATVVQIHCGDLPFRCCSLVAVTAKFCAHGGSGYVAGYDNQPTCDCAPMAQTASFFRQDDEDGLGYIVGSGRIICSPQRRGIHEIYMSPNQK
jgi:hypothetical protein